MNRIKIGCIADDFTGASDAASFLEEKGLKTLLFTGTPERALKEDVDAVVIALKTRTEKKELAVSLTLEALQYLKEIGTEKYYVKYCSTFDSTPEGNIGPIVDAVMENLGVKRTVLCPSLPVNGRKVVKGHLYVHDILLSQSSMKDHPLTPMKESEIRKMMDAQSRYKSHNLSLEDLMGGRERFMKRMNQMEDSGAPYYVVPDYFEEIHGKTIVELFRDDVLYTGGSGLIGHLAEMLKNPGKVKNEERTLLLAGSCSSMTLKQIRNFEENGGHTLKIDPLLILEGKLTADELWERVSHEKEVLVYSSEDQNARSARERDDLMKLPALLENIMASLAVKAVEQEYGAVVVAGGETSGAVTRALGTTAYHIGESIATGVPFLLPVGKNYKLLLKSGNFGEETFFTDVLEYLEMSRHLCDEEFISKVEEAISTAKSLFERGKTSGSSANISFRHRNLIYISRSGSCFGKLTHSDFSVVTMKGKVLNGIRPSKEFPLHRMLYENDENNKAVIHTHAFYSTVWSCLEDLDGEDAIPEITPYLRMKLGKIRLIPYAKPGSEKLFSLFKESIGEGRGYLLRNHGPVVAGANMFQAFEGIEELEESAGIAWHIRCEKHQEGLK